VNLIGRTNYARKTSVIFNLQSVISADPASPEANPPDAWISGHNARRDFVKSLRRVPAAPTSRRGLPWPSRGPHWTGEAASLRNEPRGRTRTIRGHHELSSGDDRVRQGYVDPAGAYRRGIGKGLKAVILGMLGGDAIGPQVQYCQGGWGFRHAQVRSPQNQLICNRRLLKF